MLALMMLSSLAALLFVYIFMPALWISIMAVDDSLDAHETGITLVASRNPFRESGPPANMAKLILLRHKIQTNNRRRRSSSHTRQSSRIIAVRSKAPAPWMRFGRPFGGKTHH
ncbi:hypothetical protein E4T56_gene10790 [Termitomyces sp. T112]|nr:hypothetical protein E4T56_gene10790 [Termitomyces sp. T112]KAH0587178.1 hypothetical protein H2248_005986 [Termitomyces sp. 'cryptogamus']KNZ79575.1 hypothetical protein J132_09164 [Termitomyces sp. J132]